MIENDVELDDLIAEAQSMNAEEMTPEHMDALLNFNHSEWTKEHHARLKVQQYAHELEDRAAEGIKLLAGSLSDDAFDRIIALVRTSRARNLG